MLSTRPLAPLGALVLVAAPAAAQLPHHRLAVAPDVFTSKGHASHLQALSDWDQDGVQEIAVAAPSWGDTGSFGRVFVHSGRTGAVLQTFDGEQSLSNFGRAIADLGDVTGDGVPNQASGSGASPESAASR